jgi:hypothetical protein
MRATIKLFFALAAAGAACGVTGLFASWLSWHDWAIEAACLTLGLPLIFAIGSVFFWLADKFTRRGSVKHPGAAGYI